jgi:hypothetical protein
VVEHFALATTALPTAPDTAGIAICVQQMSVLPYVMRVLSVWMMLFTWLMMILSQMAVNMYLCLQHRTVPVKSVKLSHL